MDVQVIDERDQRVVILVIVLDLKKKCLGFAAVI